MTPSLLTLFTTAPGRCHVRSVVLRPLEPLLWWIAAGRRRLVGRSHTLVAVTGSFGKTTTARAIRCALSLPVAATAGPNSRYALALALLQESGRAPFSVFEVGIGKLGQMAPMARALQPDLAVVTSIGSEHASTLGARERTREEKFELVRGMRPGGVAVLNGDDPHVRWMAARCPGRVVTFGFGADNDVRGEALELDWPNGTRVTVRVGHWQGSATLQLFGAHMVMSALAAVAAAHAAGISPAVALTRLTTLSPTPGRMQLLPLPNGAYVLRDDYKSGLETIDKALDVFAQVPATRRIVVLGEITDPPAPQRQQYIAVGERLAPLIDYAVLVGRRRIGYRTGMVRGGLSNDRIVDVGRDWRRAWETIAGILRAGDVVLIKGRHDQRLDRVSLAALGHQIGCDLPLCSTPLGRCDTCPMLARGWGPRVSRAAGTT